MFERDIDKQYFKALVGKTLTCCCGAILDCRRAATLLEPASFPVLCGRCFDAARVKAQTLLADCEAHDATSEAHATWRSWVDRFEDETNRIDGRTLYGQTETVSAAADSTPHPDSFTAASRRGYVHGRCGNTRRGCNTVYRWKRSAGPKLSSAFCPQCGRRLHRTSYAAFASVVERVPRSQGAIPMRGRK